MKYTEKARRKMSEAQRRRGTRPAKAGSPWTEREDDLVRTLAVKEVAKRTGRTLVAVWASGRRCSCRTGGPGRRGAKRERLPER